MAHNSVGDFCSVIGSLLREDDRPEASATAKAVEQHGVDYLTARRMPPRWSDELRHVLETSNQPVARACLDQFDLIPWLDVPVAAPEDIIGDILMTAPILGPNAPIPNTNYRTGFYYQKPNTYYQLHSHKAAETYYLIAGEAVWTVGDDTRLRKPGDVIHHSEYMPHAFEAGSDGLFAMWRWSGDIRLETYALLPDERTA